MAVSPSASPGLLTGWGRTAPTRARVYAPGSATALSDLCRERPAAGLIARGLGRSYGDAAQNAGGRVVETHALGSAIDVDTAAGRAVVDAGVSIGELVRRLVPLGWCVPVVPGTEFVTVGGAIAADIHGKNHHSDGGFCDHVISLDLVTANGERRTLTRTGDSEAFLATTGGMGLTGVVVRAAIQLLRIESSWISTETSQAGDLDDLLTRLDADVRFRYSVAWVDGRARGRRLGRGVVARGDHATRAEVESRQRGPRVGRSSPRLAIPWVMPARPVRSATIRVFNEYWFWRASRRAGRALESLESFFWPLDGLLHWNRLYGPRGLLQYQLAIPAGEEDVLRLVLERFARARCGALAVLKRFGPGRGMLSFPIDGWTLAVDAPVGIAGIDLLLDELDGAVARAGGRIYLAKDARMRPELVPVMYPEVDRWRAVREKLDPDRVMQSDLARRLSLLDA